MMTARRKKYQAGGSVSKRTKRKSAVYNKRRATKVKKKIAKYANSKKGVTKSRNAKINRVSTGKRKYKAVSSRKK